MDLRNEANCGRTLIFVSVLLSVSLAAADDAGCPETDTPRQCLRRFLPGQAEAVAAAVAAANTGAGSPRVPSAVKDFLSVTSANVDASLLDDRSQALTSTLNVPVARWQVQLETLLDLSNADDVRSTLSFNPTTRRFGRSIAPHREMFESTLLALLAPAPGEELGGIAWTSFDVPFAAIVEDAAARAEVIDMFELAAKSPLPAEAARFVAAFATLLGNQPQLYAAASFDNRRRTWQGLVTWEIGTRNLNGFRAGEEKECPAGRDCAEMLARYVRRSAGRLALSLAFQRLLERSVDVADPYVTPEAEGLVYSAAYGRRLAKEGRIDLAVSYDGTRSVRDTGSVVLLEQREPRRVVPPSYDRFVVTGTYTQKLSRAWSLPLSVVWSERSESQPGDCRTPIVSPPIRVCEPSVTTSGNHLTVHVGLTYKLPPRVPEWRSTQGCYCPDE